MEISKKLEDKIERSGLADESSAFLYSSLETLRPGDFHFLGYNPGGDPDSGKESTIRAHIQQSKENLRFNEYLNGEWMGKKGFRLPASEALLQQRVKWMFGKEGLDPNILDICSSNLVFIRSKNAKKLKAIQEYVGLFCEIHEAILSIVQPKFIIAFSKDYFNFICNKNTNLTPSQIIERNSGHGNWKCRMKTITLDVLDKEVIVISVPHLSRYKIQNHGKVIEWMSGEIRLAKH